MAGHAASWGGGYPNLTLCNGWANKPSLGLDYKYNTREYSGQSPAGQVLRVLRVLSVLSVLVEWLFAG